MSIANARPCPHCGSSDLRLVDWSDDSGEYDAIECQRCLGAAPAAVWNNRAAPITDYTAPTWKLIA